MLRVAVTVENVSDHDVSTSSYIIEFEDSFSDLTEEEQISLICFELSELMDDFDEDDHVNIYGLSETIHYDIL